ncbi:MAG: S8 family serine peptidase [Myxococcota bacterium]
MHQRIVSVAALCCAASIISTPAAALAAQRTARAEVPAKERLAAPAAEGHGTEQLVYHWEKIVEPDGSVTEDLLVDTAIQELESGAQWIDLDQMVDAQGRRYQMIADAWQDEEDAEVHYAIRLVRYVPRYLSEQQLGQAWWEAHPDGSREQFDAFVARRNSSPPPPSMQTQIDPELLRWIDKAGEDDQRVVSVQLQPTESPLDLPRVSHGLFDDEPAFALAQMEARLLTIEARKSEIESLQAPLRADLRAAGGEPLSPYWIVNAFDARVTPTVLRSLRADPRVLRLEPFDESTADANNLDDMRQGVQAVQFHDAGFEGEVSSGRSAVNDIFMAVIDDNIDADHPAWNDTSGGSSRLTDVWRHNGVSWTTPATSATATPSHGTKVAGVALADLTQGQDPAIVSASARDDRTGLAPEARFAFIESSSGTKRSIEKAVDLSVDVINYSRSVNYNCQLSHSTNDAVDEAMLDGVFFVKSAGSNGAPTTGCNIGTPGAASGAFSVTATDRSAVPLNTGLVGSGPSHGPDSGRAVVAIAANGGPEGSTAAAVDDAYGVFGATSSAAPVVAGSAAVLKEHLIDRFSAGLINEVGFLYATMLVAGDGQMDSGVAMANEALDGTWGAGRLRLRLFDGTGMDGPWRMRLFSRTIDDGEVVDNMYLHPDAAGVNQALSTDVERIRAAVFWHEPNIEDSTSHWAEISSRVCHATGCYGSGTSTDQRQRLRIGNVAGGKAWRIGLTGLDVPDSNDSNYYSGQDKRKVYVAVYWEDEDRDDGDGPSADIW